MTGFIFRTLPNLFLDTSEHLWLVSFVTVIVFVFGGGHTQELKFEKSKPI